MKPAHRWNWCRLDLNCRIPSMIKHVGAGPGQGTYERVRVGVSEVVINANIWDRINEA